jgi:hypothetical protein
MISIDDLKTIFNKGKKIATASLWDVEKKD